MKYFGVIMMTMLLFTSCLKQSIADAILTRQNGATATLSYVINGNTVSISVPAADKQNPAYYTLGCTKSDRYALDALGTYGEFTFSFYTDSLKPGNYKYTSNFGDNFITNFSYPSYVHALNDSMSFNITSYTNGHISGNFSGQLTPLISQGSTNIWGDPGSVIITNGSFENVPVFY